MQNKLNMCVYYAIAKHDHYIEGIESTINIKKYMEFIRELKLEDIIINPSAILLYYIHKLDLPISKYLEGKKILENNLGFIPRVHAKNLIAAIIYITNKLTQKKIADVFGITQKTISVHVSKMFEIL